MLLVDTLFLTHAFHAISVNFSSKQGIEKASKPFESKMPSIITPTNFQRLSEFYFLKERLLTGQTLLCL